MKKHKYLIILLLCLSFLHTHNNAFSQEKEKEKEKPKSGWRDKVIFGGIVGITFGSYTFIDISPSVGYIVTPRVLTGLGLTYQYYSESSGIFKQTSHIFGYRVFSTYTIIDKIGVNTAFKTNFAIFAHAEYEALNLDRKMFDNTTTYTTGRFWAHSPLIGAGIRQPFGKHSSFNVSFLFNLNYNQKLPYSNPVVRIGVYF